MQEHCKVNQKIRLHILIPLCLALVIIIAISVFSIYTLHMRDINSHTQADLSNAKNLFDLALNEDAKLLTGLIDVIQQDSDIQNAWLAKDREALLEHVSPIFDNISSKNNATHFYFHDLDKVCFLRVHKPERHGDHIDRFTIADAEKNGKVAWGVELGPLGTFTLRVVYPWQIDGKLVGYIELGEEIEHIVSEIKNTLGLDVYSIINKSYLNRAKWEEGMKMLGRKSNWDQFPNFITYHSTFDKTPLSLVKYLEELKSCEEGERPSDMLSIKFDNRNYQGRFFSLIDAGNRDVGDIIVIADITKAISGLYTFSIILTLSCVAIALLLLGFFYCYLGRIEHNLTDSYSEIENIAKFPSENPNPVLRFAEDGEVLYSNEAGEVLLNNWNSKIGETVPQKWSNLITKAFASGKVQEEEEEEEEEVKGNVFSIVIAPVKEGGYANLYARDITEQKKANEALRESMQEAEAANQAKSQFLANMSHEIRTPMNAIIGFGDILAEESPTEMQEHYINIIRNSGNHLLLVIDDILDFSRIEAGKMDVELREHPVNDMLNVIESMMHSIARQKGLEFEIRTTGDLPANIITDAGRLQQCLINLINNALKFTKEGHVHLNIALEERDDQSYIRFDVEDTGIGIPDEMQEKIFNSFTQADESHTREYGGTGLGLAITKRLAKLLGGELTLTSYQDEGSVFSLVIPSGLDGTDQPLLDRGCVINKTDDSSEDTEQSKFSNHVLVVEDIESNQMLIETTLNRMGMEVTIAEDGNIALQKVLTRQFDLILMDIQMPNMNGYEATRALRKEGIITPIIALTANAMKGDDKKCLEAGCDDYLSKPVDRDKLMQILQKYLPVKAV